MVTFRAQEANLLDRHICRTLLPLNANCTGSEFTLNQGQDIGNVCASVSVTLISCCSLKRLHPQERPNFY